MKRTIFLGILAIGILFISGCSAQTDVSQKDYDALEAKYNALLTENSELTSVSTSIDSTTEQTIDDLSIIAAFMIWQDYYYQNGILEQTDTEFNERLGTLIAGIDNTNLQAAYYAYYKAEVSYQQVLATLPKDDSIWTVTQYDNWLEAGKQRSQALGQVGGYLNPLLNSIEWFNP